MIHEYIYHENRFLICEEECIVKKRRFINRVVSFLTIFSLIIPNTVQFTVSAEESEKYPYSVFGRNGITMSASSNLCMNGNMHTNKNADISYLNGNINGRITTGNDIEKRVKHVYSDQKIMETYFTENCDLHEEEYVYSDMNIHINNPIFCYNNITLDGNVSLNSNLGSLMNINITGEVKNANTSVVYSKYGDITIENDSTANINGLIYVPLGTLTINSPNINLNGVIIADKIVINGSSVNINYKDDIAQFIGNTSEVYDFSGLEYLPEEWLGDTDEDELFDIYEKVIDTDPFDSDTDDDGLPDGYEIITLNTDPLEIDTDENGISDADEDFDSDNLSNLGEYNHGTEPFNPDTDEDGFMDGDEVYTYGTEPLNPDTDNDGLLDGEESYDGSIYAKYGVYFDPLNPDTNENGILDGDEVFGQRKNQAVETHDKAITEISVEMDTNGNLERNLTIESMYEIDAMSTNVYALIGEPFNFETPTSFNSATITFKIDQTKLGDTLFDNLIILWYNEEEQIFEEMETVHDEVNSTVSTTTTHFSQYMVVDSAKWYANWNNSLSELRNMWIGSTSYQRNLHTIILMDCSASVYSSDPFSLILKEGYNGVTSENIDDIRNSINSQWDAEHYCVKSCNRFDICDGIINNKGNNDAVAIITFAGGVVSNSGFSYNKSFLRDSLDESIGNYGSTGSWRAAVNLALSMVETNTTDLYRIVLISDTHASSGTIYADEFASNVILNVVNVGSGAFNNNIESVAQATGGDVYNATNASSLTYESGGFVYIPEQYVGEDSDGDGIPDLVELYGLKPNGDSINTNPNLKDSDGDGIEDNEELGFIIGDLTSDVPIAEYVRALKPHSDPAKADSDGDGLDDELEQLLGTSPIISDTDNDGLSDGFEIELWYDPLDSNPDGDSYNDKEEYQNGTDPFTYDQTDSEWNADFVKGFFLGDFVDCNSVPTLLGQVTSGFVPIVADARDVIANGSNGEWGYALLSGIGLAPAAGDVAKIAGSLGEFIAKHVDDAPTIIKAISKIAEQIPDIAKYLPSSALDDIVKSLKNGQAISKAEYIKLKEIFEASGKNLDELIELPFKYADEIASKITRIAGNYKNLECVECADELMKYLKSIGQSGKRLNLTYGNGYIIHNLYSTSEAISYNGKHSAILFNNKVYDNLFPNGIDYNDWINGFEALGEKTIETILF